jgi:archaellum component FlaF (FlaF/FlaG flagellin family)
MSDFAVPAVAGSRRLFATVIGASLIIVALLVALVVVYVVLNGRVSNNKAAIRALSTELASAQQQADANTAAIKANTAAIRATKLGDLSKVKATLSTEGTRLATQGRRLNLLASCVPEIQSQINGLNISTAWAASSWDGTQFLTSAYLTNDTNISQTCSSSSCC